MLRKESTFFFFFGRRMDSKCIKPFFISEWLLRRFKIRKKKRGKHFRRFFKWTKRHPCSSRGKEKKGKIITKHHAIAFNPNRLLNIRMCSSPSAPRAAPPHFHTSRRHRCFCFRARVARSNVFQTKHVVWTSLSAERSLSTCFWKPKPRPPSTSRSLHFLQTLPRTPPSFPNGEERAPA